MVAGDKDGDPRINGGPVRIASGVVRDDTLAPAVSDSDTEWRKLQATGRVKPKAARTKHLGRCWLRRAAMTPARGHCTTTGR